MQTCALPISKVELNADGDYWLLEKVSSNRWDLVEGFETGSNANGDYFRYADGTQRVYVEEIFDATGTSSKFYTSPIPFADMSYTGYFGSVANTAIGEALADSWFIKDSTEVFRVRNLTAGSADDLAISIVVIGRWY